MQKLLLFFSLCAMGLNAQTKVNYPPTRKAEQLDTYFGRKVYDPYRWLEDDNSAETKEWVNMQNTVTEQYLQQIPFRESIRQRLTELWNFNKSTAPFRRSDRFLCYKNNGLQNQNVLYVQKELSDPNGEVLLDPNTLSEDGTTSLSMAEVSKNGKYLAYGISKAGSDWVEIHVKDVHTKKELNDVIKWVKFSGIAWKGNGFYYSRYDAPKSNETYTGKNQFHKLYYHTVGTPQEQDQLIYEDKSHPDYNFTAQVTHDERFLIVYTSQSTSGEKFAVKDLSRASSELQPMNLDFDYDYRVIESIGTNLFVLTNHGAPNYKLIKINMNNPHGEKWKDILPERESLLENVSFCNGKILASYLEQVSSHLYVYTLDGGREKEIVLPPMCKLNELHAERPDSFFTYSVVQFIAPQKNYVYYMKPGISKEIFAPNISFKSDDYVTDQVFFPGKDGTKIPMFITHKKGLQLNGDNPCFVFGYGGFNISYTPEFRIDRAVFLEAGGIYCVPNIRGGGEFGEKWHRAGTKCEKQNVFDDFIAACNWLVENKYTSHEKLAIHGRSNGGLLIGAVMTQQPGIAKVAIPTVGVLDMLRFHKFTIGRAWTVDYGSSEDEKEFACLYKYSPLHNVRPRKYPATLILTGDHDDRVVPAHSFKFAATLQENNTGDNPTLIRVDVNAGHGAGKPTSKQIEEFTDMWSFVFYNLGIQPKN